MLYILPGVIRFSRRFFILDLCLQQLLADIEKKKTQQGVKKHETH